MTRWLAILCVIGSAFASATAADPDRETIQQAVERGLAVLERGAKAYPSHQACFACHHQTLPMLAMAAARDAGLRFDAELFQAQRDFTRKNFEERKARLAKGEHVGGRAATVSYGLWALRLAGDKPDGLTEAMTSYLLSVQQPDGRWQPPSNRPPLESSSVSCTVLVAWALREFPSEAQQEQMTTAVQRAKTWLAMASLDEQEDLNFALWGERLLDGSDERITSLKQRVLDAQQPDGGWRQKQDLASDAYATGQTLFVLSAIGVPATDAALRQGAEFLLRAQQADGSWHVVTRSKPIQPWFDNGDPHDKDQFISITASGWATAALARSLIK
jgi:N-acyl-D-amino-acid deacylase